MDGHTAVGHRSHDIRLRYHKYKELCNRIYLRSLLSTVPNHILHIPVDCSLRCQDRETFFSTILGRTVRSNKGPEWEYKYSTTLSLTSAADEGVWLTPGRFSPGKEPRHSLYARLGRPQDRSQRARKISPPTEFELAIPTLRSRPPGRTVDCAMHLYEQKAMNIPAHYILRNSCP